eukprot:3943658-Alexandrium_andersonii.AAC.1
MSVLSKRTPTKASRMMRDRGTCERRPTLATEAKPSTQRQRRHCSATEAWPDKAPHHKRHMDALDTAMLAPARKCSTNGLLCGEPDRTSKHKRGVCKGQKGTMHVQHTLPSV